MFSTKDRANSLADGGIRLEMQAYLATVFKEHESPALTVGGTQDHMHVLCALGKTTTLAKVIGEAKRNSSRWIKTKGGELARFQWQNGYGAFSVSHSNVPRVREYVDNQATHHQTMTFQDELRALLRKHGVRFDEQYVWG